MEKLLTLDYSVIMTEKNELRKTIKSTLLSLSENQKNIESELICNRILNSKIYKDSQNVLLFYPLKNEVNVKPIIEDALKNKCLFLPKVFFNSDKSSFMEFYKISKDIPFEEQMMCGAYGITEPCEKIICNKNNFSTVNDKNKNVICIVPGTAFDKNGNRMGKGGGYYDKYFCNKEMENVKLLAVCYSECFVENILVEEHDVKMNALFLPDKELYF